MITGWLLRPMIESFVFGRMATEPSIVRSENQVVEVETTEVPEDDKDDVKDGGDDDTSTGRPTVNSRQHPDRCHNNRRIILLLLDVMVIVSAVPCLLFFDTNEIFSPDLVFAHSAHPLPGRIDPVIRGFV